jgi:vacuolar-type H+-ATPase catalytic subunit A/Vma1
LVFVLAEDASMASRSFPYIDPNDKYEDKADDFKRLAKDVYQYAKDLRTDVDNMVSALETEMENIEQVARKKSNPNVEQEARKYKNEMRTYFSGNSKVDLFVIVTKINGEYIPKKEELEKNL